MSYLHSHDSFIGSSTRYFLTPNTCILPVTRPSSTNNLSWKVGGVGTRIITNNKKSYGCIVKYVQKDDNSEKN